MKSAHDAARDELKLTRKARREFSDRLVRLREQEIPSLATELADRNRDGRTDADYQRAVEEAQRIDDLLTRAGSISADGDPDAVRLGDTVTIQFDDGTRDRYMIVHPVEAPLDNTRISADSPLSRAIVGRRRGDEVEVQAPGGIYRCRVVRIEREDATSRAP